MGRARNNNQAVENKNATSATTTTTDSPTDVREDLVDS